MGVISNAVASFKALAGPRHKYRPLPAPVPGRDSAQQVFDARSPRSKFFRLSMGVMLFSVSIFLFFAYTRQHEDSKSCVVNGTCTYDSHRHWGQYSPYFPASKWSQDSNIPRECEFTFVAMLSRHGSRYPTAGKSMLYKGLIERIQRDTAAYGKGYEFLKDYQYTLGSDDLTPLGEREMAKSASKFWDRYHKLGEEPNHPFVRASGSDRVVKSAQKWLLGYYEKKKKNGTEYLDDILVIPEGRNSNNTLDHGTCEAFETGPGAGLAHEKQATWKKIWATPIMERLNEKLPGANITLDETVFFMDLCPFNTVASKKKKRSEFCRLFSKEEWLGYEYYESLEKWYGYGPGNPLGPTQGVGYVNELISRLTEKPVKDHTSTNKTLDSALTTFPLNRLIYADFTHDNTLMTVYSALGLFNNDTALPPDRRTRPSKAEGYSASLVVPFGARMYVEKMSCDNKHYEMMRVLVDDRIIVPRGCDGNIVGLCSVDDFLGALDFAKGGGHWDQC